MPEPRETLQANDRLVVEGRLSDFAILKELEKLIIERRTRPAIKALVSGDVGLVETILSPHTTLVGKTLRQLNFREKYGLTVLSIWRKGAAYQEDLRDMALFDYIVNNADRKGGHCLKGRDGRIVGHVDGVLVVGNRGSRFVDVIGVTGDRVTEPDPDLTSERHGENGFRLDGVEAGDGTGCSVASAGDVNGDGLDDILIGAFNNDDGGGDSLLNTGAGKAYLIFGRTSGWAISPSTTTKRSSIPTGHTRCPWSRCSGPCRRRLESRSGRA